VIRPTTEGDSLSHANSIQSGKHAACFKHSSLFKVKFNWVSEHHPSLVGRVPGMKNWLEFLRGFIPHLGSLKNTFELSEELKAGAR